MLKGKLLGQYIICEMVTTEKEEKKKEGEKKMTVRKCGTINRYVNVGHVNTPSEAGAHKNSDSTCDAVNRGRKEEREKEAVRQMTSGKNMIKVDIQLPEN